MNESIDKSLNETLAELGYNTQPAMLSRKDILKGEEVILKAVSANDVWEWLKETKQI